MSIHSEKAILIKEIERLEDIALVRAMSNCMGILTLFLVASCQTNTPKDKMDYNTKNFLKNEIGAIHFNYTELEIANERTFEELQHGYRINPVTGESLIGEKPEDWKDSWYVIGYISGDPMFVDIGSGKVFTTIHGMDEWDPELVSNNINDLERLLDAFKILSKNRENPDAFDQNPLTDNEISNYRKLIRELDSNEDFWTSLTE